MSICLKMKAFTIKKTVIPYGFFHICLVGELLMGIRAVVYLASSASFSTNFFTNCGRGEGLRASICLLVVVGGKQGHAPCRIFLLQQSLLCQSNCVEIIRLFQG